MTTFSTLKTDIAGFLNKTNLTATIPTFIRLAEARMNRLLRCRQMAETITLTGTETFTLPCDFAGVQDVRLSDEPLDLVALARMDRDATGTPVAYAISGDQIIVTPVPAEAVTLSVTYRSRFSPLAVSNPSNWLLDRHYDAYLYGSLMQAAPYLRDDERVAVWGRLFLDAINEINNEAVLESTGTEIRIDGGTIV